MVSKREFLAIQNDNEEQVLLDSFNCPTGTESQLRTTFSKLETVLSWRNQMPKFTVYTNISTRQLAIHQRILLDEPKEFLSTTYDFSLVAEQRTQWA
jgi:hypothetical protein